MEIVKLNDSNCFFINYLLPPKMILKDYFMDNIDRTYILNFEDYVLGVMKKQFNMLNYTRDIHAFFNVATFIENYKNNSKFIGKSIRKDIKLVYSYFLRDIFIINLKYMQVSNNTKRIYPTISKEFIAYLESEKILKVLNCDDSVSLDYFYGLKKFNKSSKSMYRLSRVSIDNYKVTIRFESEIYKLLHDLTEKIDKDELFRQIDLGYIVSSVKTMKDLEDVVRNMLIYLAYSNNIIMYMEEEYAV